MLQCDGKCHKVKRDTAYRAVAKLFKGRRSCTSVAFVYDITITNLKDKFVHLNIRWFMYTCENDSISSIPYTLEHLSFKSDGWYSGFSVVEIQLEIRCRSKTRKYRKWNVFVPFIADVGRHFSKWPRAKLYAAMLNTIRHE